jgi:hypothetical protein
MTQEQHFDVASYALGILDERDAARFEDHLIDCPACAIELESLLPVADILSDVDADALVATEKSRKDGVLLKNMMGEVRTERRRANSRRLYSLAAAVVTFAVLSVGALFAGAQWLAPSTTDPSTVAGEQPSARSSKELDPLPQAEGGVGLGGTKLPGDPLSGEDSRTGVKAAVGLLKKDWGTQVSFAVSNIKGPRTCQLVAVRPDASRVVLSTWNVGEKGWGTSAQGEPLLLQAATALPRDQISYVMVEDIKDNGQTETLVRLP